MSELFPPAVARFTSDVTPYVEGLAKANGATRDWQAELAKAGTAAQKAGTTAEAAANRAAAAQRRAAEAAGVMAKANSEAAASAQKLAAGEISQEEAAGAATKASRAQTTALEAQARASVATQRAAQTQADAARASAAVQTSAAAKSNAAWASVSTGLNKAGKLSTIALAAIGIESIHLAGNFQQQTNVLVTAAGELPKNLQLVRDGILNIATTTGTAWQDVTAGVYVAEKAGFRGADALNVVKASAQGAREEQANLATVLNATTSVMASYGLKASDAVRVTNEIKTAAGESKTTMELFAGSLATVLPIAAKAGISFAGIAGELATMTQHGTSADEATQNLAFTIRALQAPNAVAQKTMSQLGLSVNDVTTRLGDGPGGRGLNGTLNYLLSTVLSKVGPAGTVLLGTFNKSQLAAADANTEWAALPVSAQKVATALENGQISLKDYRKETGSLTGIQSTLARQFAITWTNAKSFTQQLRSGINNNPTVVAELKALLGGSAGLNTLLQTTGTSAAGVAERTQKVADAAKNAGANVSGWASTQKLFNVRLDEFKQQAAATGIRIGTQLLPPLAATLGLLTRHPAVLHDIVVGLGLMSGAWVAMKIAGWISSLNTLAGRLLGVSAATRTAAASTEVLAGAEGAAGAAGAAEGAGAALGAGVAGGAAAGAGLRGAFSRLAKIPLLRIAVPVAVTYVAVNELGLKKSFEDLLSGQAQKAAADSPKWLKPIAATLGKELTQIGFGNAFTGNLSGTFVGKLAIPKGFAEQFQFIKQDQAIIADFNKTLAITGNLVDNNSKTLVGNSNAAQTNRAAIGLLVQKAKDGADAQFRLTGKQSDLTAAMRLGVGAIESVASALGFNKQQVDAVVRSLGLVPPETPAHVSVTGADTAVLNLQAIKDALDRIPFQKQIDISVIGGVIPSAGQIANATQGGSHGLQASGGIYPHGVPGGVVQWAEAGGESYIPLAPAKRQRSLGLWAQTGKMLGVPMADGGIVGGNLQDFFYALDVTANLTGIENQRAKFNTAHFSKATAASVPALQLAAEHAAESAKIVGGFFGAHKSQLLHLAHSGSAAQRKAAGSLYNVLSARAGQLSTDAHVEEGLLTSLRRRYAGQEALVATPGPATRDLSYLALSGAPTTTAGPSHAVINLVATLDGQIVAQSVSKHQLRVERRNLSNGATAIRNH